MNEFNIFIITKGETIRFSWRYPRSVNILGNVSIESFNDAANETTGEGSLNYEMTTIEAAMGGRVELFIKPLHSFTQLYAKYVHTFKIFEYQ